MQRPLKTPVICFTLGIALGVAAHAAEDTTDEPVQVQAAQRADLENAALRLADPASGGQTAALYTVIRLAAVPGAVAVDARDQLIRATGHPDHRLARLAEQALHDLEHADRIAPQESEAVLIARAQRQDFERARTTLLESDATAGRRRGAMAMLAHLAAVAPDLADEAHPLLGDLARDSDAAIAALAEVALEALQGRSPDPRLAGAVSPLQPVSWDLIADAETVALLSGESPGKRLQGLAVLAERIEGAWHARGFGAAPALDDSTALLLHELAQDPDPRLAFQARSILSALAGDRPALRGVYLSPEARRSYNSGNPRP